MTADGRGPLQDLPCQRLHRPRYGLTAGVRLLEIGDRATKSLPQLHPRLPSEDGACDRDVGPAHLRIVGREREALDRGAAPRLLENQVRELAHRELVRVADVGRLYAPGIEQLVDPLDLVVHVAERARLTPVAVHGERLTPEGLHDEVRDHAAVAGAHARTI